MGSVGQNSFFSEHGHVAYQIKENHQCSNMVTHILLADTPDREDGFNRSKCSFFLNMVMLHINLMGITKCSRMVANFCLQTPPGPWGGGPGQNSTLSEHGHVAYQLKGNHKMQQNGSEFFSPQTQPRPWGWVHWSKFNFFRTWSCYISN